MARAFVLAAVLLVGLLALACDDETAGTTDAATATVDATTSLVVTPLPSSTQPQPPTNTPDPTNTPAPTDTPPPTVTNRRDCGAISDTAYRSEGERQWYLDNCIPPTATLIPSSTQTGCGAAQNPWRYDFCSGGKRIYSPPSNFCSYFACIPNFWNGGGYVIQCRDAMFGKSGGIQGSCSHHGGNSRALMSY